MGCTCGKTASGRDIRDSYKIGAILGSGSFGQVRACVKKSTNQSFAVKIMSKDPPKEKRGSNNVDFAMMFRNEVTILTSLEHPHIIKLYEFYEDKHYLYAIMDKCEGGELFAHIVKKRRFAEKQAAGLCLQMLKAIQFVHDCGIVHRDIKAENFLFSERSMSSRLVLIDFGMSTKVLDDRYLKQLCGSPHYVAPELIRRNYRFKVDMWALGVVVFLMLYGKYPFEGADQKAIVQAILSGQPEYSSRSACPSHLAIDFMNRLLEKDPERRMGPDDALEHEWITTHATELGLQSIESPQSRKYNHSHQYRDSRDQKSLENQQAIESLDDGTEKDSYSKPKVVRRFDFTSRKIEVEEKTVEQYVDYRQDGNECYSNASGHVIRNPESILVSGS